MSHTRDDCRSTSFAGREFDALLDELRKLTGDLEQPAAWPRRQFERLAEKGVLGWVIPAAFGGTEISQAELTCGYERLASACLVTTFVLTQRNGACQRIAASENDELKAELLPPLCRGEVFATVGVSHLTTSRQHLKTPAVEVQPTARGFEFNGTVPWVTGAPFADYVVTGGTCEDGRQVLAAISTKQPGVTRQPPPQLLALNASQTGSVVLEAVEVSEIHVIAGPVEQVMKRGKGGGRVR